MLRPARGKMQPLMLLTWLSLTLALSTPASTWDCTVLSNQTIEAGQAPAPANESVWWSRLNCTGKVDRFLSKVGPIVVNVVDAPLSKAGRLRAVPAVAAPLAPLSSLAATFKADEFVPLAGINGGYFWRVDSKGFFDDVCVGKTRADAERAASATDPNAGIGDSLTIIDGKYISSNCDKVGNSRPAATVLDFPLRMAVLERGGRLSSDVRFAIGAGPNLVSYNQTSGSSFIDIMGDNINILEHASNTAIGLSTPNGDSQHLLLVTFDGEDGCVEYNPKCGVNAREFAAFLLDHLHVHTAMNMDQGGSTTMWVRGQPNNGVVSNPGMGERSIFNGLFLGF